jgi:hypothetical protein
VSGRVEGVVGVSTTVVLSSSACSSPGSNQMVEDGQGLLGGAIGPGMRSHRRGIDPFALRCLELPERWVGIDGGHILWGGDDQHIKVPQEQLFQRKHPAVGRGAIAGDADATSGGNSPFGDQSWVCQSVGMKIARRQFG